MLKDLAAKAFGLGKYADALQLYSQALAADAATDETQQAVLCSNMSAVLLRLDRPEEALQYATAATQVPATSPKSFALELLSHTVTAGCCRACCSYGQHGPKASTGKPLPCRFCNSTKRHLKPFTSPCSTLRPTQQRWAPIDLHDPLRCYNQTNLACALCRHNTSPKSSQQPRQPCANCSSTRPCSKTCCLTTQHGQRTAQGR